MSCIMVLYLVLTNPFRRTILESEKMVYRLLLFFYIYYPSTIPPVKNPLSFSFSHGLLLILLFLLAKLTLTIFKI